MRTNIEKDLGMRISVKSFSDLPFVQTDVRTSISRGNTRIVLSFEQLADQEVSLLVDDMIITGQIDVSGKMVLSGKKMVKNLRKY